MIATETVGELVANYGFPPIAFALMYRLSQNAIKENTEAIRKLRREMAEE